MLICHFLIGKGPADFRDDCQMFLKIFFVVYIAACVCLQHYKLQSLPIFLSAFPLHLCELTLDSKIPSLTFLVAILLAVESILLFDMEFVPACLFFTSICSICGVSSSHQCMCRGV